MPFRPTSLLRALTVLLFLLGSIAGHDAAMAETMPVHTGMADSAHMLMTGHEHGCAPTECDRDESPCCVMGQCLIGIVATAQMEFGPERPPTPEPDAVPALPAVNSDLAASLHMPEPPLQEIVDLLVIELACLHFFIDGIQMLWATKYFKFQFGSCRNLVRQKALHIIDVFFALGLTFRNRLS